MPTTPRVGPAQRARLAARAGPPPTGPTADQHESARLSTAQHGSEELRTADSHTHTHTHTHTGWSACELRSELAAYTHTAARRKLRPESGRKTSGISGVLWGPSPHGSDEYRHEGAAVTT